MRRLLGIHFLSLIGVLCAAAVEAHTSDEASSANNIGAVQHAELADPGSNPSILLSTDKEVCDKLLTASLPNRVDATALQKPIEFSPSHTNYRYRFVSLISRVSEVDISETYRPDRIGYFNGLRKPACPTAGIVLLDGDKVETGPRNSALLQYQWDLMGCVGAEIFVVRLGGHDYVEIDSGRGDIASRARPVRTLLRLTEFSAQAVCRIVRGQSHPPTPPASAPIILSGGVVVVVDCNYIRDDGMPQVARLVINLHKGTVNGLSYVIADGVLSAKTSAGTLRIDLRSGTWSSTNASRHGDVDDVPLTGSCRRTN